MNLTKLLSALVAVSLFLAACGPPSETRIARSNERRVTNPTIPEDDLHALVDGNNAFAIDMYQSLPRDGNLVFSPFSISLALAMTYAGARGETESQMADTLHFELPQDRLHPAFNALDLALEETAKTNDKDQEPLQLNIANAVWAEQTFPFLQEFLDTIALNYGAGINLADFINNYEPTRKEINGWVSDKTNEKIQDLLPDGSLDSDTRMVLVNAIYFKADWLDQFDSDSTKDAPFHLLDGSMVDVPMMHQGLQIPYVQGDGFQAVELAYAGNTAAMDIIVPDEGNFQAFDSSLNSESLNEIFSTMQPASVDFGIPKFTFTSDFELASQLENMGMKDAFDRGRADFSGMTGGKDLFISDVVHKAFIAVDEAGTEAAAATGVILAITSAPMFDINFVVDRPFIFVIRDLQSGQILFLGRVVHPVQ
jgi:serpin B